MINLIGGPYTAPNYRARTRVVFQNKAMMSQYRAVGHPIATAVTEALVDMAARRIGMDPVDMRRRNLMPDDAYPCQSPTGMRFEGLSHHAALDRLMALMDYDALRRQRAGGGARARRVPRDRARELHRAHQPGPGVLRRRRRAHLGPGRRHGAAGRRGGLTVQASVTEQGQGTGAILTQIAADAMGVPLEPGAGAARRHRRDPVRRRHLGVARRRHRRRGGVAGGPGAARAGADAGRQHPAGGAGHARHRDGAVVDAAGRAADRARGAGAHRVFPARHPAAGRAGGAGRHPPLRAARVSVRLHQRRPGFLARGGRARPGSSPC